MNLHDGECMLSNTYHRETSIALCIFRMEQLRLQIGPACVTREDMKEVAINIDLHIVFHMQL